MNLNGAFQAATLRTPLISSKVVKGLCLSFNYLLSNFSRIQINKVIDGQSQNVFEREIILNGNWTIKLTTHFNSLKNFIILKAQNRTWQSAYVSIKSNSDFHIEITGYTGNDTHCLLGVDDVELNFLENCKGTHHNKSTYSQRLRIKISFFFKFYRVHSIILQSVKPIMY